MAMSLQDFLIQNSVEGITKEFVLSQRLKNFKFKIKPMTGAEFNQYQQLATKMSRHNKVEFDSKKFNEASIINHTVEPNFKDAESIKKAGCKTAEEFLNKCLLAGEQVDLAGEISKLSGFDQDINELREEAKNS